MFSSAPRLIRSTTLRSPRHPITTTRAAPAGTCTTLAAGGFQDPCSYDTLQRQQRYVSSNADSGDVSMKYVYVHPLSQIVLVCLQSNFSEWLMRRQLNNNLKFHRDGTFEIEYNRSSEYDTKHTSRIWTSFDESEKKHWLTVKHGRLFGRYMLQDNRIPAWNRGQSLPERIEGAVNEMVEEIEAFERTNRRQGGMK